jgi:hypothetical protein
MLKVFFFSAAPVPARPYSAAGSQTFVFPFAVNAARSRVVSSSNSSFGADDVEVGGLDDDGSAGSEGDEGSGGGGERAGSSPATNMSGR